jgi:hypothetical protein
MEIDLAKNGSAELKALALMNPIGHNFGQSVGIPPFLERASQFGITKLGITKYLSICRTFIWRRSLRRSRVVTYGPADSSAGAHTGSIYL